MFFAPSNPWKFYDEDGDWNPVKLTWWQYSILVLITITYALLLVGIGLSVKEWVDE